MLISDVMVISRLKILNSISMEFMECLNEDAKKKKGTFCTSGGRAVPGGLPVKVFDNVIQNLLDSCQDS